MAKETYLLLDSRGAFDSDDAMVLLAGSAKECCEEANKNTYGQGCVVTNQKGEVMWEWFATGKWMVTNG